MHQSVISSLSFIQEELCHYRARSWSPTKDACSWKRYEMAHIDPLVSTVDAIRAELVAMYPMTGPGGWWSRVNEMLSPVQGSTASTGVAVRNHRVP
jgi:hypothetical protein